MRFSLYYYGQIAFRFLPPNGVPPLEKLRFITFEFPELSTHQPVVPVCGLYKGAANAHESSAVDAATAQNTLNPAFCELEYTD